MTRPTSDMQDATEQGEPDASGRRTRLREFQTQLVERMQAARTGGDVRVSQLGVLIGRHRWLLNLREAGEIVSVGAMTKVPLTQDWFLGLSNIRGNLVSVVDFARFLGEDLTPTEKENRIVAFSPALSFNCGLLVTRVLGLRNVDDMTLGQEQEWSVGQASGQERGPASAPWSRQQYVDRDGQVWAELNLSLLVQDPLFLHVGL